jgi:FAD/FMN-containing dehydrogenase
MRRRDFCAATLAAGAAALLPHRYLGAAEPAQVPATSRNGAQVSLRGRDVADLRAALRGSLLVPADGGYDQARRLWNGMFDRKPALIARCAGAADVVQAVNFARAHDLLIAVRGGGHSLTGQSACDGGIMIDLSPMRGVRVDPAGRTARIDGGVLLGELDRESQAFGLITPAGRISHTGAAGLTLGGGFGRLTRRFGLACDNLIAADVITPDGRFVRANAQENADLLWGLKGGGGNFGVVSSFEYQLHQAGPLMFGGMIAWPSTESRRVLQFHAELIDTAPDELFVDVMLTPMPPLGRVVALNVCWSGAPERGEQFAARMRALGKPVRDTLGVTPYVVLQSSQDAGSVHGWGNYERSGFLTRVTPELLEVVLARLEGPEPPGKRIVISGDCGGAFSRVAPGDTAFLNRDARSTILVQTRWEQALDPAISEAHMKWARETFDAVAPHTKGFYVNAIGAEDAAQRIRTTYGGNYERLVALKRKYDPQNFFRRNANIPPG